MTIENDAELTSRYINYVVYYLHPSYKINVIKVLKSPFLLSRTAFGSFIIGIEIYFKTWTTLKPVKINHILCFKPEGKVYEAIIDTSNLRKKESFSKVVLSSEQKIA